MNTKHYVLVVLGVNFIQNRNEVLSEADEEDEKVIKEDKINLLIFLNLDVKVINIKVDTNVEHIIPH